MRMSLTVFSVLSGLAVLPLIVASIGNTMSPNLSVRQSAQSVPQVLTANTEKAGQVSNTSKMSTFGAFALTLDPQ